MTKEQISQKLAARMTAIIQKNFAVADAMRDELTAAGIRVYDVKHPTTGEKFTFYQADGQLTIWPHEVSPKDFALLLDEYKKKRGKA